MMGKEGDNPEWRMDLPPQERLESMHFVSEILKAKKGTRDKDNLRSILSVIHLYLNLDPRDSDALDDETMGIALKKVGELVADAIAKGDKGFFAKLKRDAEELIDHGWKPRNMVRYAFLQSLEFLGAGCTNSEVRRRMKEWANAFLNNPSLPKTEKHLEELKRVSSITAKQVRDQANATGFGDAVGWDKGGRTPEKG